MVSINILCKFTFIFWIWNVSICASSQFLSLNKLKGVTFPLEERAPARYKTSSRIQCVLKCKLNLDCVDVIYSKDGYCTLLMRNNSTEKGTISEKDYSITVNTKEATLITPVHLPSMCQVFAGNTQPSDRRSFDTYLTPSPFFYNFDLNRTLECRYFFGS